MDDNKEKVRDLPHESFMHEAFTPLDFLNICGFPNDCYDCEKVHDILPEFHGNDDVSTIYHISSYCKLMVDFNVYCEDDLMIVFTLTLEGDALNWFYGLLDESIASVAKFFERFLLRRHDRTVDEIEQLAKQYDALISRVHLEQKEQQLEENIEDQRGQPEIDDPIEEASKGSLFEYFAEEPLNIVIIENNVKLPHISEQLHDEKLELPQFYVTENVHEQFYDEGSDPPQVHSIDEDNNTCFADQLEQLYGGGLYLSPVSQWVEDSCAHSKFFYQNCDDFICPNNLMLQFSFICEQILGHLCYISLSLSLNKHRKKKTSRDELKWLHWLWTYT